jgi:hypothetical protein
MTKYNPIHANPWTDKELVLLRELKAKGKTFPEIAMVLQRSRNSCIGAYHRNFGNSPARPRVFANFPIEKPTRQNGALSINFKKKYRKMAPEVQAQGKPWPSLGCLEIIGEPRFLLSCGLPRQKGRVYCENHTKVNYAQSVKKQ